MDSPGIDVAVPPDPHDGPANVLLRYPEDDGLRPPCPSTGGGPGRRLLVVALDGDPDARIDERRQSPGLPDDVAVLSAADTRAAAAAPSAPSATTTAGDTTTSWATVGGPGDIGDIGAYIDRCLTNWSDDATVELCFDSISALIAAVDLPTVYRFLHVLTRRVDAADAVAHYHLYPDRQRRRHASTVETLFSDVREYDAATGSWVGA